MSPTTGVFASRVTSLRSDHNQAIVDWVTRRIIEEPDLDAAKLKASTERYIDWSAAVADAAVANLGKRRWIATQQALSTMVSESLSVAASRKTETPKGMPLLLKAAFFHNAFLSFLSSEHARLVDADLEKELQTGLVLLGEARGQDLYRAAREMFRAVIPALVNDVTAAGERSLAVTPEPVAGPGSPGGRTLSAQEAPLAGHWVHSEFHSSGNFSGRFDLHMVLLADGTAARTTNSAVVGALCDRVGNWIGSLDSVSGLDRSERGRWEADGTLLTLEMNDGSAYEYRYSQRGFEMVTVNTNGGGKRFWTRSQH